MELRTIIDSSVYLFNLKTGIVEVARPLTTTTLHFTDVNYLHSHIAKALNGGDVSR